MKGGHLVCETETDGNCKSIASDMCDFMNDCNGNGSCNSYGKCECSAGFYGADCSSEVTDLTKIEGLSAQVSVNGNRWFYYVVPEEIGDVTFSVNADRPVSVYVRKGTSELPDAVNFDALIKKEKQVLVSSQGLTFTDGVIIAVHCEGAVEETTSFVAQLSQISNVMVRNSFEFLDLAATVPASAQPKPAGIGMDGDE